MENTAHITLPFSSSMMNHEFFKRLGYMIIDSNNQYVYGPIHTGDAIMVRNEDKRGSRKIVAKIRGKKITMIGNYKIVELVVTAYNLPHELFKKVFYDFLDTPEGKLAKLQVMQDYQDANLI
jgi:hypothetical protein